MIYLIYACIAAGLVLLLRGVRDYIDSNRHRGRKPIILGGGIFFVSAWCAFDILVAVMCFLSVGIPALVTVAKKTKVVWARPAAGALAIIGVIASIANLAVNASRPVHADIGPTALDQQIEIQACGQVLGAELERVARTDVLVLVDASTDRAFADDFVKGLTAGIDSTMVSVITEEVRAIPMDPMDRFNQARAAVGDKIDVPLALHPQCKLVVAMVPIPADYFNAYIDRLDDADDVDTVLASLPKFVLVHYPTANVEELLKRGLVVSLVVNNPTPVIYDESRAAAADIDALFQEKYLMVDSGNISQIQTKFPQLFN